MAAELIVVFCGTVPLPRPRRHRVDLDAGRDPRAVEHRGRRRGLARGAAPVTFAYAAPFAVGAVLFLSLVLPRMCPKFFGSVGAFDILSTDRVVARSAGVTG
jgi:hypothetical protein